MAFSLQCNNKGCYQIMEAFIDPQDDKVYCSACEAEITNITYFTKAQMKSAKQYRKRKSSSFVVQCSHCGEKERPQLINQDLICPRCHKAHSHLSEVFKNMLRTQLKNIDE